LAGKGLDGEITVASAGVGALPGMEASPGAVRAMKEMGLDLGAHRARPITRRDVEEADLVLTMTAAHREMVRELAPDQAGKVFTLAEYAGRAGDVPDPVGAPVEVYRRVAAGLRMLVGLALERYTGGGKDREKQ
ncbi:MAG: low molecular weight protein arginine phosphatase, partial [Thermoanaerobacteraceae bacterium]|nr:low molecular weight protein arginine phosphatase [Thermoanaerobacteraceae bacterium]